MDNENEQLLCKIEEMEAYIQNLETTLSDREDENSKLADKMHKGFEMLDSVKIKQDELFQELDNKNKELICELDEFRDMLKKRSLCYQEEIDCLEYQLDEQVEKSKELENVVSMHQDEIKTLQKQLSCTTKRFNDCQRLLKSELKVKEQDIICIQNTLADKITENTELEKKLSCEQDRNEGLQSSMYELRIKYEKDVCATQAESTRLRNELKDNVAKLEEAEHKLQEARDEMTKRTAEFEKSIQETRVALCKEKNKLEEKYEKLKAYNKSLVSNAECINTKLCNSQSENNQLKRRLADQHESIKLMEAMKNRLQQEMENNKENEELSSKILMTEREQHARELQIFEKKLEFQAQDERELKELSKKLSERILCLKKVIHVGDMKSKTF